MPNKKNITALILAPIAIASVALLSANAKEDKNDAPILTEKQQAKYDRIFEGRTAGKPRHCLTRVQQKELTYINDHIFIFGSRNGKTIFVNKPFGGCSGAQKYSISYSRPGSALCKGEIVQVFDPISGSNLGSCAFSEFIPYTRESKAK